MIKKDSKQKILDAAIEVFAQKGYHGSTTKEIAAAAGLSEGSVFKHYKTKRDILLAALERLIEILSGGENHALPDKEPGGAQLPPEAVFKALAEDRARLFAENSQLIKVIITEALFDKSISGRFYYALRTKLFPALHERLQDGVRQGVFRDLGMAGDMVAMRVFISMAAGYMLQRNFAPELIPVGEESDAGIMADIFINGIAKQREETS